MGKYVKLGLSEFDIAIPLYICPFLITSCQFNLNPPQLITIFKIVGGKSGI